jgi:hypothetical protein
MGWQHQPNPRRWARFGPAHAFGSSPAHFQKKKKILFNICDFPTFLFMFCLILIYFFCHFNNTNPVLKYPVFVKTSKNTKKFEKKKNMFLCIWPSVSKLKNHIVFFIHQKIMF